MHPEQLLARSAWGLGYTLANARVSQLRESLLASCSSIRELCDEQDAELARHLRALHIGGVEPSQFWSVPAIPGVRTRDRGSTAIGYKVSRVRGIPKTNATGVQVLRPRERPALR